MKYSLTFICLILALISSGQTTKLNLSVDERIELLTVIQYLSEYPILNKADIQYKKDIDGYFKDFKDHEAVTLNRAIYRRFFGFDAPPVYMVHFSLPEFRRIAPIAAEDMEAYGYQLHRDTLTLLMKAFKDFYEQSRFHDFYLDHKGFYDDLTKPVYDLVAGSGAIEAMEKHYGQTNKEYNIVLAPLLHNGGYGPTVSTPQGKILYAIIGPADDSGGIPSFDLNDILSYYVLHEFSHAFCNPIIYKLLPELQQDSCLLHPIRKSMKEQGYGTWEACLYEHLVRANEIILTEQLLGTQKADQVSAEMAAEQWTYLKGLVPIIRSYQSDRKKYPTLEQLMPLIKNYFDNEARRCR